MNKFAAILVALTSGPVPDISLTVSGSLTHFLHILPTKESAELLRRRRPGF